MSKEPPAPAASPAAQPGTPLYLLILVMILVIGPLIALSQVIAYWRTDVVDDQMFGYYGWRIAHGATVYLDVWDNKPPAIYWINALGMLVGADSYLGVIAMCVLALVVAHAAFFIICSTVYSRGAAAITTMLLGFFLTHAYYTGGTNRTETFLVACELAGVAFYLRGFARQRARDFFLAGLLCGLAFLFKQVGLAAWGCMGVHLFVLMLLRDLPVRTGIKRGLLLVAGVAVTLGLAAACLAAQGALREALFASFGFNRYYFAQGESRFPYSYVNWVLLWEHIYPTLLLPLLMTAAALIHAVLWWLRPQHRPADILAGLPPRPAVPRAFFLFLLWFLVAFYGANISPHRFRHYLVPSIPPLLLLCGYLVHMLRAEVRLLRRLQQRAWVTAAFVIMAYFAWDAGVFQFREFSKVFVPRIDPWLQMNGWYPAGTTGAARYEPAIWESVGDAVAEESRPDQKIQCLNYLPGVYLHARRINASRYTTTEKMGQLQGQPIAARIAAELATTLINDPPALMVVPAQDYLQMSLERTVTAWPQWARVAPWLEENYRPVREVHHFLTVYVFKRKDLVRPDDEDLTPQLQATVESLRGLHPQ